MQMVSDIIDEHVSKAVNCLASEHRTSDEKPGASFGLLIGFATKEAVLQPGQ